MTKKVWLITGASKGIGLAVAKFLLKQGDSVIATSRNEKRLIEKISSETDNFLPLKLDITNKNDAFEAIKTGVKKFKKIDVLVNNAGYLQAGSLEDTSNEEIRSVFEVNVLGTINMIKAVIPEMRKQGNGHIINTSSIASIRSMAYETIYSLTKFAVNGLSSGLYEEVKLFNIKVTNVLPGFIRTEFLEDTSYKIANIENSVYDYKEGLKFLKQMNGRQNGNPLKIGGIYRTLVEMENPPIELMIGTDAVDIAIKYSNERIKNTKRYKELSELADY